jgi:hypothetical protein
MPLVATRGAASAQGFGEFAQQTAATYIEDVFSTWLYTGTSATQTITNGIDLSTKGGLVWVKRRSAAGNNILADTNRGASAWLSSNLTNGQGSDSTKINSFTSSGFVVGSDSTTGSADNNYASWTFRKQPKFFDIVTYTATSTGSVTLSHNLGSTPGAIIRKITSGTGDWFVWHRSLTSGNLLYLNLTLAEDPSSQISNPTSTTFTTSLISGQSYVFYLFAHNAGGFGLTGTDNVISCGSVTGSQVVNLGYEPQWVLSKCAGSTGDWSIVDNMRGAPTPASGNTPYSNVLVPNTSDAETTSGTTGSAVIFNSTGFRLNPDTVVATTYIYIAIRRGPMKTPTTGTSVFSPYVTTSVAASASGSTLANALYSTNFVVDMGLQVNKSGTDGWYMGPRLAGNRYMKTETTAAEAASSQLVYDSNVGAWGFNGSYGLYSFRRAPGFFDVVCYTGTGVARTVSHNLGVVPELMIVKRRNTTGNWLTYSAPTGNSTAMALNSTTDAGPDNAWNYTTPTSSVFSVSTNPGTNASGGTFVAYLFASVAGVSKVGSYTGTGALQTINCGFTGGARFVLIKRTDSTGDWWLYDSARGITSGNDPYMFLNVAAAEVTGTNYVDTDSTGFKVTAAAPAGLNASGGTYIFLAVA